MIEVFQHAVALVNLPFTVLLALVLLYWLISLLGMLDLDFLSPDLGSDFDIDGGDSHSGSHALMGGVGRFLHLDAIPFMIVLSILAVFAWMISIILNGWLNPAFNAWIGLALMPVSFILGALCARILLTPFRGLFSKLRHPDETGPAIIGQVGTVITSEVTDKFGMAELEGDGASLKLQIRAGDESLTKGDPVLFTKRDPETGAFYVRKSEIDPKQLL